MLFPRQDISVTQHYEKYQKESKSQGQGEGPPNAVFYAHLGYGNHELIAPWHPGSGGTKVRPS